MNRRNFLATAGTVPIITFAGCSSDGTDTSNNTRNNSNDRSNPETSGNDSKPFDVEPKALLPAVDVFGDEWEVSSEVESWENNAAVGFYNPNEAGVEVKVTIYDTVEGAKSVFQEDYETHKEEADRTSSVEVIDGNVASESYVFQLNPPVSYFRDANARCKLTLTHPKGDSVSQAQEYAVTTHRTWRD